MAKPKKTFVCPPIKQDMSIAILMLEMENKEPSVVAHKIVEYIFNDDVSKNGTHSAEFLQTYFSAIMFVRQCLINFEYPTRTINALGSFAGEIARRYEAVLEKDIENRPRMLETERD